MIDAIIIVVIVRLPGFNKGAQKKKKHKQLWNPAFSSSAPSSKKLAISGTAMARRNGPRDLSLPPSLLKPRKRLRVSENSLRPRKESTAATAAQRSEAFGKVRA